MFSGIVAARPDPPFAVRMLIHQRRFAAAAKRMIRFTFDQSRFLLGLAKIRRAPKASLLILHPQTLGYKLTVEVIEERSTPAALFLLDSSFFCIASYNHVSGEVQPCQRCIGGRFEEARVHGCAPFPKPDPAAADFVVRLRELVLRGRVILIAQNERQAALAQTHFGLTAPPAVVGLWTEDWESLLAESRRPVTVDSPAKRVDIVFHGYDLEPKGARWLEEVATHLPSRNFLFPFPQLGRRAVAANCDYSAITWETGLEPAIRAAEIVVVPSLWSAPIEGALVKSVVLARCVAVVENPSAFADELPEGLLLKLPTDARRAAAVLDNALRSRWTPAEELKKEYFERLRLQRRKFLEHLLTAIPRAANQNLGSKDGYPPRD
jgi:hypothetical protein